jgi:hypothetical protein
MLNSDFALPEVENRVTYGPPVMPKMAKQPPRVYDIVPRVGEVNGSRLLDACGYDRRLAAVLICTRKNWKELLKTMASPEQSKNVEVVVIQLRQALGLPVN